MSHCRRPDSSYLDDHNGLLNNITDSSLNQIQQHLDASWSCGFDLDCSLTDGFHRLSNEIDIHLRGIPSEYHKEKSVEEEDW